MTPSTYRIVGTAGHIDHGKSALVRALTGIDPDRLREEKERGITIDLGFADTTLGDLQVGFVDVPGHERFVKNMLAGVGGIDAVLLVVAADESVMPQTREHLAICELLGIRAGVVAVTKCDLVDEELAELVQLEVQELLEPTGLAGAEIVRTSVHSGEGLEELRSALGSVLGATPGRPAGGVVRLPVDRVFTIRGFGTVVTGTLLSGTLHKGTRLVALPGDKEATVRGIQVHGHDTDVALAGQRTALNLQGVQVEDLARGMVLARPGSLRAGHLVDARIRVLAEQRPIRHLQRVRFHHGAAEVLGRIAVLDGPEIPAGGSGLAQLRLEVPYPALPGDRFIVRRYSPLVTIGGGEVIDLAPRKHRARRPAAARLTALERAGPTERLLAHVTEADLEGVSAEDLATRLGITTEAVAAALSESAARGAVEVHSGRVLASASLERVREQVVERLARHHRAYPLRPAMPKEELRASLDPVPVAAVLDAAAALLLGSARIRAAADGFALADHVVRVPAETAQVRQRILDAFVEAGLAPAAPDAVVARIGADPAAGREMLHHLIRGGELVRVKDDLVVHAEVLERLVDGLRARFPRGAQFSVAEFRDWAGVTRKHAIPLLEHLDALRVTRRVGDARERL